MSKLKTLTLVSFLGLAGVANAQVVARPISRPAVNLNTLNRVIFPGNTLKTKIVKPKVKRAVRRRLKPVVANKFGPTSKVTIGLYDKDGNVNGSKVLTGKQIHDSLEGYTKTNTRTFRTSLSRIPRSSVTRLNRLKIKTAVVKKTVFDRELRQNIEVVEIPQDLEVSNNFVLQGARLRAIRVLPIMVATPVIVNPSPTHQAKPYSQKVGYDKTWGSKSRFSAYLNTGMESYGSRQKRVGKGHFRAGGYVFNKNISLVDFSTRVERNNQSNNGHSIVKVLGSTKWESSSSSPHRTFKMTRESSKRQRFWIGPIPVSVGAAIGGEVGFSMNLFAPDAKSLEGSVTPYIDSYGAADAAIDVWLARAGVEGKLRIVKDSLPTTLRLKYDQNKQNLKFKLNV